MLETVSQWRGGWWRRGGETLPGHGGQIFSLEGLQGGQPGLLGQDVGDVLRPVVVIVIPGESVLLHPALWSPSSDGRLGTGHTDRCLHLSTSSRTRHQGSAGADKPVRTVCLFTLGRSHAPHFLCVTNSLPCPPWPQYHLLLH